MDSLAPTQELTLLLFARVKEPSSKSRLSAWHSLDLIVWEKVG
jgi:hypothetical protein